MIHFNKNTSTFYVIRRFQRFHPDPLGDAQWDQIPKSWPKFKKKKITILKI